MILYIVLNLLQSRVASLLFALQFESLTASPPSHVVQSVLSQYKDVQGRVLCSTDIPSFVESVRSRLECAVNCQRSLSCLGFNFERPHSCELYFYKPSGFAETTGCVYTEAGELISIYSNHWIKKDERIQNIISNIVQQILEFNTPPRTSFNLTIEYNIGTIDSNCILLVIIGYHHQFKSTPWVSVNLNAKLNPSVVTVA